MYGQGNYAPQFRQGPPATTPPPPYQQGPPIPPPTYQQGPPASAPTYQQGRPPTQPPLYHHGPPPPPPPVYQQGPPAPPPPSFHHAPPAMPPVNPGHAQQVSGHPAGMVNMGQSFMHPPPSMHGSSSGTPSYPTPQQAQYPSTGTQNFHNVNPPVAPVPGTPLAGPSPPPPRVFHPAPSAGQMLYQTMPPPPLHGAMQGHQHIQLPPPPPTGLVSVTPTPFASSSQASSADAHPPSVPPPPPPPPPSSPPPLPVSPPPLSSLSTNNLSGGVSENPSVIPLEPGSDTFHHSGSDFDIDKVADPVKKDVKPAACDVSTIRLINDASLPDDCTHSEVGIRCKTDSVMSGGAAQKRATLVDLPLPPPKPMNAEVVRNIEVLCQFIAKVGPDFENMARTKEAGNPKFAFLFGGEPGSAAAIGHEYFMWTKKKCHMELMARNETELIDAKLQSTAVESSQQSISSTDDGPSASPAVSDMDMEDDMDQPDKDDGACQTTEESKVNQPDNDYHACQTIEDSKGDHSSSCGVALLKGHLYATQSSTMPPLPEDVPGDKELVVARLHGGDYGLISSSCIEDTIDSNKQASYKQLIKDSTVVKVSPPFIEGTSKEVPGVIIKDGSPFKLIQDYASDDSAEDENDKKACLEDVSPVRVSPAVSENSLCLNEEKRNNLDSDSGVDNVSVSGIESSNASEMTEAVRNSDSAIFPNKLLPTGAIPESLDSFPKNVKVSPEDENRGLLARTKSFDGHHHSDALPRNDSCFNSLIEKVNQEVDGRQGSAVLNVDEFGRLVREGGSDSESDEMHYSRRRSKRGRSRSRSQSPQEGRWRRSRSPRRRRDKRSRSRSWSPKKHSNRNKSPPSFRRANEFGNDRMRRDSRGQPECFNFLKGRCYRGSSCKFLHRDSAVGDARHWNRSRQDPYQDIRQDTMGPMLHGDTHYAGEANEEKKSIGVGLATDKHDHWPGGRSLSLQTRMDASMHCTETSNDGNVHEKKVLDSTKIEFGQSQLTMGVVKLRNSQGLKEVSGQSKEPQQEQEQEQKQITAQPLENVDSQKQAEREETFQLLPPDNFYTEPEPAIKTHHSPGKAPGQSPGDKISVPQFPQANVSLSLSTPELQDPVHMESLSISHPVPVQTSSLLNQSPQSQPYLNQVSVASSFLNQVPLSQPSPSESFRSQPSTQASMFSDGNLLVPPPQIPPPPQLHLTPHYPKDDLNSSHALHPPRENRLQPPGANFHSQSLPVERYPSYQPPVNYHSQQTPPMSQSWANHPPLGNESAPRPAISDSEFRPLQYQQNTMVPRNDVPQPLLRRFPSDVPQFQTFHSEPRPAADILHNHSYGGSSFTKENQFMHPATPEGGQFNPGQSHDLHPARPLREEFPSLIPGRENIGAYHSQHTPFISEQSQVQSFPRESLPPAHSHLQPSSFGLQLPVSASFSSHMGVPGSVDSSLSRYPLSYPGSNEPTRLADATGLKTSTSTHYNPFASTFEQIPASFMSNSIISRREMDSNFSGKYDSPFSLSHGPVSGDSGGPRLRHTASPSESGRLKAQILPSSGKEWVSGDQYDPIFDSIEPANAFKKFDHVRDQGSQGPSDAEDKQKAVGRPVENDEYDGTAIDAEVGTVENASPQPGEGKNWSPTNPIDLTNPATGEVEIDQVKSPGKSKKKKDSRSMKLFKIAIADFVKDILKPSWRQGNMSKEAFKTIVKKTVDKVSGAMQSHQVPKSQAKINQYVDSSRRKLTKLVMGYVDKYTKI